MVDGFTQNQNRLDQLKKTIQLVNRTSKRISSSKQYTSEFIDVLSEYTKALDILDDYDHQRVEKKVSSQEAVFKIEYKQTINAIEQLRIKFGVSELLGNQKDESFKSSIAVIDQTFDSKELYQSIEEKVANLLYLVVKIILLQMAINVLQLGYLFSTLMKIIIYILLTESKKLAMTP